MMAFEIIEQAQSAGFTAKNTMWGSTTYNLHRGAINKSGGGFSIGTIQFDLKEWANNPSRTEIDKQTIARLSMFGVAINNDIADFSEAKRRNMFGIEHSTYNRLGFFPGDSLQLQLRPAFLGARELHINVKVQAIPLDYGQHYAFVIDDQDLSDRTDPYRSPVQKVEGQKYCLCLLTIFLKITPTRENLLDGMKSLFQGIPGKSKTTLGL